jgi:hypothetical protein
MSEAAKSALERHQKIFIFKDYTSRAARGRAADWLEAADAFSASDLKRDIRASALVRNEPADSEVVLNCSGCGVIQALCLRVNMDGSSALKLAGVFGADCQGEAYGMVK